MLRGRRLLGDVIPYDGVWRTGATQFTASAPITLAGLPLPAGTSTLWTIPREQITISIEPRDTRHGTLAMAWGAFRWTAPNVVK